LEPGLRVNIGDVVQFHLPSITPLEPKLVFDSLTVLD
jgi:hypothetical protein